MPEHTGPVVVNTGPVSAFSLLDRLFILPRLYGEVLIQWVPCFRNSEMLAIESPIAS